MDGLEVLALFRKVCDGERGFEVPALVTLRLGLLRVLYGKKRSARNMPSSGWSLPVHTRRR